MIIAVFSNNKNIKKYFSKINNKNYNITYLPQENLKKDIKKFPDGSLIYYDIDNLNESLLKNNISFLSRQNNLRYVIIDLKNKFNDIASLFFQNCTDYISRELFNEGLNLSRIKQIINYKPVIEKDKSIQKVKKYKFIPSGNDWNGIQTGKEYTFCFMYIEFENYEVLKTECGSAYANKMLKIFQGYLTKIITKNNGRVWMWMDACGLIILPFNGKKCDIITTCFRLIIDQTLISVENGFKMPLSYKIAVHIGNTVYKKRGETGTIVSESINTIFHLGQKFAKKGNFYLSEEAAKFIPDQLKKYFTTAGNFEGKDIARMKILK